MKSPSLSEFKYSRRCGEYGRTRKKQLTCLVTANANSGQRKVYDDIKVILNLYSIARVSKF
jgi:hypothetical protein